MVYFNGIMGSIITDIEAHGSADVQRVRVALIEEYGSLDGSVKVEEHLKPKCPAETLASVDKTVRYEVNRANGILCSRSHDLSGRWLVEFRGDYYNRCNRYSTRPYDEFIIKAYDPIETINAILKFARALESILRGGTGSSIDAKWDDGVSVSTTYMNYPQLMFRHIRERKGRGFKKEPCGRRKKNPVLTGFCLISQYINADYSPKRKRMRVVHMYPIDKEQRRMLKQDPCYLNLTHRIISPPSPQPC